MKARAKKRTVHHAARHYTVILERDSPGYHAFCPALPGCHTCGDTIEEAMKNIKEAVEVYCESLRAHNEPLPEEKLIICPMAFAIRVRGATAPRAKSH
jgi:predicted RNase H-like HicB family nuclease